MRMLTGLTLCMLAAVATADSRTPEQVVRETADVLAQRIEGRQQQLEENPAELYKLVDDVFLPVFDTDYAGRLVLGKHWRKATPAQRQEFIDAFYDFMLRSYAKYVLRFEKDSVQFLPGAPGAPDPRRTVVKTEMKLADGTKLPVFYSLRQTKEGWRAFDVRIEGISYVQNYRNQFSAEIGTNGIDAVIARLKRDAANVTTSPPVAGGK
ncbi:MAG: ABC transporter substrate-binding protein [Gammaproteobacteria bacterium]|nr:ABC transporter substrate-binding protein [Gammaproteobacteria bacterium]MDH5277217.1 ABC transporter substrate-binding protein [Gammaproteobacteria bacterium]